MRTRYARRDAQRRDANGAPIPWAKIRLAYITREDRPTYYRLEREFGLGETTVQKRGKIEGWKKLREEHHRGVVTEAQKKIGGKQTIDLAKSIRVLEGLVEKLVGELDGAKAHSLEGIAREIRETIKMLNMYILDRQAERNELDEAEDEKLSEILLRIKRKAPEEYAELKEVYEEKSD